MFYCRKFGGAEGGGRGEIRRTDVTTTTTMTTTPPPLERAPRLRRRTSIKPPLSAKTDIAPLRVRAVRSDHVFHCFSVRIDDAFRRIIIIVTNNDTMITTTPAARQRRKPPPPPRVTPSRSPGLINVTPRDGFGTRLEVYACLCSTGT